MPEAIDARIQQLWQRRREAVVAQVESLVTLTSPSSPIPTPAAVASARRITHDLAGTLGMYGLQEPSRLAIALDDAVVAGALTDRERLPDAHDLAVSLLAAL